MPDLVQTLLARHKSIRAKVDPWMDYWQELAEVYLPGKDSFTSVLQEGERMREDIYDGTPRASARDLAAAIDGLIKPKTSKWSMPTIDDEALLENENVKLWLETVGDIAWKIRYNPKAGFIQRSAETDRYLTVFGHGMLWVQERRDRSGLLYKTFFIRDFGFEEDGDGAINSLALDEYLTAMQAISRFGPSNLHKEILDAASDPKMQNQVWNFAQIVLPRDDRDADMLGSRSMAFVTAVIDVKHEAIVGRTEGGFHEFPAAIPRWDTMPGSCYGRSVGMLALADSLTLQAMGKTLLIGGERAVDPPALVPADLFVSPARTFPGGLSVFDPQALVDGALNQPIFPWPVATQLPIGRDMQYDYRQMVEAAFFKNVMKLPIEGRQMTATEILERKEEFVRVLGPTFGRLEPEYLGATCTREFGIMERAGAFPPRPEELEGMEIKFEFASPIQQARKAIEVAGFSRAMEVIAPLAQAQPEIFDNFDGDEITRDLPDAFGMPTRWLRPKNLVEEIRDQRAEQMAAEAGVAAAAPVAGAIKDVATAQAQIDAAIPAV